MKKELKTILCILVIFMVGAFNLSIIFKVTDMLLTIDNLMLINFGYFGLLIMVLSTFAGITYLVYYVFKDDKNDGQEVLGE